MQFNPVKAIGAAFIGVLALILFLTTYFTVSQNERAVVSSWGQFSYVADPGLHFKMPFRDSVTDYPVGIMSLSSGEKWVNTYTVDNQEVDIAFTIFYRIPADRIAYIYANNRDYSARLFSMAIDRLKAAMGQVNVQMVAEKRGELRDRIKAVLIHDAAPLGVEVTDFQLTDLQYTKSFREAVGNAAVQKALIESREYERQQAEKSAQTAKITAIGIADKAREEARGTADARLLQATAEAKAIQLQGEAQAAAIKAQAEALKANTELTELRKAERWDGKLPTSVYAGAPIPFMAVK
jgi:regulator of protease activity HflC (stomatin/prohibitin superfamily)